MMRWRLRPARDHGLAEADRLRSQAREAGLGGLLVRTAWQHLIRGYLSLIHDLRINGREHLPASPPFIMMANHQSHLDALVLAAALRGEAARRCCALAAGDAFFASVPSAAFAAYSMNALPVWRDRSRLNDLAGLRTRLTEDALVFLLFPEGTRSRDGRMGPFHPGLGALVAETTVPVVPCHMGGTYEAWPAGRLLPRPRPVRLQIGPTLDFSTVPNRRPGWMEVAARCEEAVRRLGPPSSASIASAD